MFSSPLQLEGKPSVLMTLGECVEKKMVANETLGYFIGRTAQFLILAGIKPTSLRFRQHLPTEMAHYACDCWDAEIEVYISFYLSMNLSIYLAINLYIYVYIYIYIYIYR